jgi:hypothetical protein
VKKPNLNERGRRWARRLIKRHAIMSTLPITVGREGFVAGHRAAMREMRKRDLATNQPPCASCPDADLCAILGCNAK